MTEYDVAVVGLGAMGSAVLYQLAKLRVKAVGIDRYVPPHAEGSSHGDTRITRRAIGEGETYVPFVMNSHRIWRELEEETGETLLVECGALMVAAADKPNSHHGKIDFLGRTIRTAGMFGIEHEILTADEIKTRFPHFMGFNGDELGYYEPGAGYVRPERCIAAQLQRARELGAVVLTGTAATSLVEETDGVRIETPSGPIRARQVVVAAGAWTAPLLGEPFDQLLTVNRQVLHWFALDDGSRFSDDAPVVIWMHGPGDADYFYAFPPVPGEGSMKAATEQYRLSTTADSVDREVTPAESEEMFDAHIRERIAGVSPKAVKALSCVYTVTPDLGFILDWHPQKKGVFVISACSGHGFKHSAGIGEAVAQLMQEGTCAIDLAPFSLSRFGGGRMAQAS